MSSWFNPKFSEFVKENENKGMLGMFWSLYWRFAILVALIYFAFATFVMFMSFLALISQQW